MFARYVSRVALVLVLAAALALPAPARAASLPGKAPDLVTGLWSWLLTLLPGTPHTDAGCDIDPDGKPRCAF